MSETKVNSAEAVNSNEGKSNGNSGEMGGMRRAIAGGLIGTTVGYLMTPEAGKKLFGGVSNSAITSKGASIGQAVKDSSKKAATKLFGKTDKESSASPNTNDRLDRLEQMITKLANGEQATDESDKKAEDNNEGSYVESPVRSEDQDGNREDAQQEEHHEEDEERSEQQNENEEAFESLKQENEDLQGRLGKIEQLLSKMTEDKQDDGTSERQESKKEKAHDKPEEEDEPAKDADKSSDEKNKHSNKAKQDDGKNEGEKSDDKKKAESGNQSKSDEKDKKDKASDTKNKNNGTYLAQDSLKKEA